MGHDQTLMVSRAWSDLDEQMMQRCIALSDEAVRSGEKPFGAMVAIGSEILAVAQNRVNRDGDVSRHAEIVALAAAHATLKTNDLSRCTLYSTVEPCAMCAFAIREYGIRRVVYGLGSPLMGGLTRWDILSDSALSGAMSRVFGKPPLVTKGCLAAEAARVWRRWNPLF